MGRGCCKNGGTPLPEHPSRPPPQSTPIRQQRWQQREGVPPFLSHTPASNGGGHFVKWGGRGIQQHFVDVPFSNSQEPWEAPEFPRGLEGSFSNWRLLLEF